MIKEMVNHPGHYASACPIGRKLLSNFRIFSESDFDRECDLVLVECGWHDDAHLYNAAKYLWRCESKGALLQDLKKAVWYLRRRQEVHGRSPGLVSIDIRRAIAAIEAEICEIESCLEAGNAE